MATLRKPLATKPESKDAAAPAPSASSASTQPPIASMQIIPTIHKNVRDLLGSDESSPCSSPGPGSGVTSPELGTSPAAGVQLAAAAAAISSDDSGPEQQRVTDPAVVPERSKASASGNSGSCGGSIGGSGNKKKNKKRK